MREQVAEEPSHPTGVRGLKFASMAGAVTALAVAPHWGAWIEITCSA